MNELMLEDLKAVELNILIEIDGICRAEGIRYSLTAGTLLGAARHRGFIPWDDDIDLFMPRPDYNRFIEYCKAYETGFKLVSSELDQRYGYLFAKAMDMSTRVEEFVTDSKGMDMGVCVDIFPVDGLGDTYEEAQKTFKSTRFKRELLVACNWKKFFRSKTRSWKYEPIRFAFFIASRFASRKRLIASIQKKLAKHSFEDSKYVGSVCTAYRAKEIMEARLFREYTDISFEGKLFSSIKDYGKYLSAIYGDYMKLPPEDKRVTHHMFRAYYADEKKASRESDASAD
jgi:lipopolysaccharide cholinephosphotransferase